jgi:hypothetical protein
MLIYVKRAMIPLIDTVNSAPDFKGAAGKGEE